jgi:hypothetical protein
MSPSQALVHAQFTHSHCVPCPLHCLPSVLVSFSPVRMTAFGTGDPDGRLAKVAHTETFTAFLTDKGWVHAWCMGGERLRGCWATMQGLPCHARCQFSRKLPSPSLSRPAFWHAFVPVVPVQLLKHLSG